jgi:4-aminobutyrate aminotransferase-like enzyme
MSGTETLVARRRRLLGPGLRQFYDFPFHPVRGTGVWLHDETERAYLDAYNNVPHVGHCHPDIVAALSQQAATLNSNTRYLDEHILDYAERLLATMPKELDVCLFVCTGSEANDLAWRLARTVTGNDGVIASADAYHGNSSFLATLDAYRMEAKRPSAVATVAAPAEGHFDAAFTTAIAKLEQAGHGVAAAYFDTCFANEGLIAPDADSMRSAVGRVRAAGGLYIADEVQAGLGRLGDVMWGFEALGPAPDIVTMGKPLGNGHPIGAVATRRDIVERFCARDRYFNTFGGNPVSCAVGLAVLEVLKRERLQENAVATGRHLASGLFELASRFPAIAAARGRGFFQGVAIRDPETGEAAPQRAREIMNAMARRGVLVGLTGPKREMLKIRPPMPFDRANAEQLVATLEAVLREG